MTSREKLTTEERLRRAVRAAHAFGPVTYDRTTMDRVNYLVPLLIAPKRPKWRSEADRANRSASAKAMWSRKRAKETALGVV